MDPLVLLVIVFLFPLLLILLVDRGQWLRTYLRKNLTYLRKNLWPRIWYTKHQRVTPLARFGSLGFHWLANHLEGWGLFRLLATVSHIGIIFAVIVFIQDLGIRKEEREARAWSLIYQSKKSPGDGGRRYALQYLNNDMKANLASLPLSKAYLPDIKLPRARLGGANLSEANLYGAELREAYLSGTILSGATLVGANLSGANLKKADLSGATLVAASLSGANLKKADLSGANLYGADLRETDLSWANLYGADLRETDLSWANLHGANLSEVNLSEVDLSMLVRFLRQAQIDSAFYCEGMKPPNLTSKLKPPPTRKCDQFVETP